MSKLLRLSDKSEEYLDYLSETLDRPREIILEALLQAYARQIYFTSLNEGYRKLKEADLQGYKELLGEVKEWDTVLLDGLSDD